jgi:cytoskeletal protein RodZ
LPGGIFSRAFVRAYASQVGLSPEDAVQQFIAQFPHDSVTAGHPAATPAEDGEAVESQRSTALTFLRLVGFSIPIAIAAVYFVARGRPTSPQLEPARPVVSVPANATPAAPSAPVLESAPTVPTAPAAESTAAVDTSKLTVVLAASRPCWVSARVDGEKVLERTLQPGEQQTIEVHDELVITAGDASAIALTLNGAEARVLGKSGEVITARMSPANFRDYLLNP